MDLNELIYDWNTVKGREIPLGRKVMLNDETLRDGLQILPCATPASKKKFTFCI